MNDRIQELMNQARAQYRNQDLPYEQGLIAYSEKFAELIQEDIRRKVIASILITDVVMEEKGQMPTSEDYIRAINKDFGVDN
jgi:FKBP-type peptidyl-prolyl cis-trans isomerase (trigger factor)